jgi:outer membrane protein assembly factor BamB
MTGYRETEQPVLVTAFNGQVFGLDPNTGKILWDENVGGNTVRVAVTEDRVYAATYDGLTALEYPSGKKLWQAKTTMSATLLVVGNRIYLGGDGKMECVSTDGQPLFKNGFTGKGMGGIAFGVPGAVAQSDVNT